MKYDLYLFKKNKFSLFDIIMKKSKFEMYRPATAKTHAGLRIFKMTHIANLSLMIIE